MEFVNILPAVSPVKNSPDLYFQTVLCAKILIVRIAKWRLPQSPDKKWGQFEKMLTFT